MRQYKRNFSKQRHAISSFRLLLVFLTLFFLFFVSRVNAQGACSGITFSFEPYEPCKFLAQYSSTSDCFTEIRYQLESGQFLAWNVTAGFTAQQISPSEIWVRHSNVYLPVGDKVPLRFTLAPDLNTNLLVAYNDTCAMVGCDIFGGLPIVSCPDPQNASIVGVKYKECGTLPYISQTPLSGWTIELLDSDGNIIGEQVTDVDGSYVFYDLKAGSYVVREVQQPGWTPKVPAIGLTAIDLAVSQQRIVNFGNCPPAPPPCDCPVGTQPGGNAVVNSDFSGSGGFSTGYTLNNSPSLQPGQYWIGSNPSQINAGFAACGDHTSGTGNMMVVNGVPNQNTTIWSQTFTMAPNSTYKFEAWLASLSSASPAQLSVFFNIGNVLIEPQRVFAPVATCNWERICVAWPNGPNATTVTVSLVNQNAATTGNDFAIDDISFRRCVPPHGTITGVVYLACDSMPYSNQPLLFGQTVQLLDTLGNLISEQVTDSSGGYTFVDRPLGHYWVKLAQQADGVPNIPANGLAVIELLPGETVVQHFGVCRLPQLTCTCPVNYSPGTNLVNNPDFSSMGGFSSHYTLDNNAPLDDAAYWVGNDPSAIDFNLPACVDHTTGSGDMLVAKGNPGNPIPTYWEQSVNVTPNTTYLFSAWALTLNSGITWGVDLQVEGNTVAYLIPASPSCQWKKLCSRWTSGPGVTSVKISIKGFFSSPGQAFAFDDISFRQCDPYITPPLSGVIYRTCDSMPYTDQPLLSGWTVQVQDTMGNLIDEQVTDSSGAYAFYNLPDGDYWVRARLDPNWGADYPSSGQYTVEIVPGGSVVANFGVCPGCSCDSIDMVVLQISGSLDTCTYGLYVVHNNNDACYQHLRISLASGSIASIIASPGWTALQMDSQHVQLNYAGGYVPEGFLEPGRFSVSGASTQDITISAVYDIGAGDVICSRAFSFQCPQSSPPPPCCPAGNIFGNELVKNGDFQLGNQDFTNNYTYINPGISMNVDEYSVLNQSQVYIANSQWACTDHGLVGGNMLVIDGHYLQRIAWRQSVNVVAGTTYSFSAWVNNLLKPTKNGNDPILALFVNNTMMTGLLNLPENPDQWIRLCQNWTATTTGLVTLSVRMLGNIYGNDAAIDDISFRECIPAPCGVSISATPTPFCGTGTLTANPTGPGPFSYQWSHGQNTQTINVQGLSCGSVCSVSVTCGDGSMSSASYIVTDNVPPVAVCNPGVGVDLDANCMYNVSPSFVDGGSTDNCQIQSMTVSPSVLTGCGTTTVTLTVTDWCGNTSTCTMGIQTIETGLPVINNCPQNQTVGMDAGKCEYTFTPPILSVTDLCDPNPSAACTWEDPMGTILQLTGPVTLTKGVSTIRCKATDNCGNESLPCNYAITVTDNQQPTLTCPQNLTVQGVPNPLGQCSAIVNGIAPTATDNCPIPSLTYLISPSGNTGSNDASGETFQQGVSTVTYTLVDCGGVTKTCSFTVTVTCPPSECCSVDYNTFIQTVDNATNISAVSANCKATLNIGNLPCQLINWIDWGDGSSLDVGPFLSGAMPFHYYAQSNNYTISFVASEINAITGAPCFTGAFMEAITLNCPCVCGSFTDLFARPTVGTQSITLHCGGIYTFGCPNPGFSIPITGKFECVGAACATTTTINWTLTGPGPNGHYSGTVQAGPYFYLPILPYQYGLPGQYTLTLVGNCGGAPCTPCVITFNVNCPDPCPCDPAQLQIDMNKGFASILYNNSCKGCFSPIALNDCDMVNWSVDGGPVLGMTNGNGTFCHTFSGAGTHFVTMTVIRKRSDGTICGQATVTKSVTLNCLFIPDCNGPILANPRMSIGAVVGGLNSGGASEGWIGLTGNPVVVEGASGSLDGWTIDLGGKLDSSDVLSQMEPICLTKDTGMLSFRFTRPLDASHISFGCNLSVQLFRGNVFVLEYPTWNPIRCLKLASIELAPLDAGWVDVQVPYDISAWNVVDTCGDEPYGVFVRPVIYVNNALSNDQGGASTRSSIQIDNFCLDGTLVGIKNPLSKGAFRIFPNPNAGTFNVEFPEAAIPGMRFKIIGLTGQVLQEQSTQTGSTMQTVQAGDLPAGLYFLQVVSDGRVLAVEKFVKQ